MYIAGAKFEEYCLNITRVIPDWMLSSFEGTTYDIIIFLIYILQKREYLQTEKRYAKKENAILLYSEKPFKQAAIIFYFIGTLISVQRLSVFYEISSFFFISRSFGVTLRCKWLIKSLGRIKEGNVQVVLILKTWKHFLKSAHE